jgi:hypothetical protein
MCATDTGAGGNRYYRRYGYRSYYGYGPSYYGYGLSYYGYRRSYYGYGKFPALPLKPFAPEPLQVHSPKACASLPTVGQFGPSAHGGCEKWT